MAIIPLYRKYIKEVPIVNKKKSKGFTLVELVVVRAIIAILAITLTPKTIGYIKEGKKTQALSQVRQVVVAVEAYNITKNSNATIGDDTAFSDINTKLAGSEYVDMSKVTAIKDSMKYSQMKQMVNDGADFDISDGIITKVDTTTIE